jgi:hypothetical protein
MHRATLKQRQTTAANPQRYLINEPSHLKTPGMLPKGHPMGASFGGFDPNFGGAEPGELPKPVKRRGKAHPIMN